MSVDTLLLLDIDGVLNPVGATVADLPPGYEVHCVRPDGYSLYVVVNPEHGRMLLDFAKDNDVRLTWATTWEREANRIIAPLIGLPELPVIVFPRKMSTRFPDRWKFTAVAQATKGKNVIWFDDEFGDQWPQDIEWFHGVRGQRPTRLHQVDPSAGLTGQDLAKAALWLKERRTTLARATATGRPGPAAHREAPAHHRTPCQTPAGLTAPPGKK